jgi:UDP-2,3-diacylglucosamine pyrophosphatase LpxH
MKKSVLVLTLTLFVFIPFIKAEEPDEDKKKFSFAFFTDIHLNKGNNGCFDALEMAISSARNNRADFILTGGDNVDIDVLGKDASTAHWLYSEYAEVIANSDINYFATVGNHDRFYGSQKSDPLYEKGMFEKYLNKSYYSFDHKGWHFIVLNTSNSVVDEEQKQWLAEDLKLTDPKTPIAISVHVPFLSVYYPTLEGRYTATDTFRNFKEIWDMFEGKNLKLVLQGHMHLYEEIKVKGVQFITGGAVSASWWGGPFHGTEEGYLLLHMEGEDFNWEYIDYGWETKK